MSRPITEFLLAVRRRLWLEAALRRLRTAVWVSSATLALFAVAHMAWQPLSLKAAVIAALTAGFIMLLPAIFSRPALTECALHADRHFGGQALLTTASESGQTGEPRPAEKVVLKRALAATSVWRSRLGEIWHAPPRSGYVLAVIPAFFAALLLQVPAGDGAVTGAVDDDAMHPSGQIPTTTLLDGADDLAAVREAIVEGAAGDQPESDRGRAVGTAQRFDDDPQPQSPQVEIGKHGPGTPGIAAATDEGGVAPGDARRRPGESRRAPDAATPGMTTVTAASIERQGGRVSGRRETGGDFAPGSDAPDAARPVIGPVPAPAAVSSWTTLTAAELAYARRYLDLEDPTDE